MNTIALLCPTRERPHQIKRLIESLLTTTNNISNVYLYLGVDEDDPSRTELQKIVQPYEWVKVITIQNNGEFIGIGKVWNIIASRSSEDIFSMIGDDMIFKTKNWDTLLLNQIDSFNFKDGIFLLHCNDGVRGPDNPNYHLPPFPVNSFIGRRYYDIVGQYVRDEWKHGYQDTWLYDVHKALGRVFYRHDILIFHDHRPLRDDRTSATIQPNEDNTTKRLENQWVNNNINSEYYYQIVMGPKRNEEIKLLANHLNTAIPYKKIISFGLWGSKPMHLIGAKENIKLAKQFYPDWICRFYIDNSIDMNFAKELHNMGTEIMLVKENIGPWSGLFWRFYVADDTEVQRFIIRDCDSRISAREAAAVQEWVDSKIPFHCMKDHPWQDGVPIMGGAWGAVHGCIPNMKEKIYTWCNQYGYNVHKQYDQTFLKQIIWPLVKDKCLEHNEVTLQRHPGARPFPLPRQDYRFFGEIFDENNNPSGDEAHPEHWKILKDYLENQPKGQNE